MSFETLDTETIYQGRAFDVRRDQVRLPDGNLTYLDIVDHKGAVTLLPLDEQEHIWFVRQYRHAALQEILELPAGVLEDGETPEACAGREIREEIGMAANRLQKIGEFYLAPGYSTEYMHVYKATELHPDPLPCDPGEFLRVEKIPVNEVRYLIETGEIRDSKTLAALFLSKLCLSKI